MRRVLEGTFGRLGIATRLTLELMLVLLVATTAIVVVANQTMARNQLRVVDQDLAHELPEYTTASAARPSGQSLSAFTHAYVGEHVSSVGTLLVVVLRGESAVVSPGAEQLARAPEVGRWASAPPAQSMTVEVSTAGVDYRTVVSPVGGRGGSGVFIAASDLTVLRHETSGSITVIAGAAGAAVVVALIGSYVALRRLLRTVDRMTLTAMAIDRDRLDRRIGYRGPADEIGRLADAFDAMLARVDRAFDAQRRMLSNVSHQLRTPLTVIRGHLEVLGRGGFRDARETAETVGIVLDEVQRTQRLVDELLVLGRSLEPGFLQEERVDLRTLMADTLAAATAISPRRWLLDAVPDLVVRADSARLRGALLNLVDNAVKATGHDDTIRLGATVRERRLVLTVSDTGHGIDPADRDRLFERHQQARVDERGAGLGLAIVRAVAEAHGGRAGLDGARGAGCTAWIELPATRIESPAAVPAGSTA